MMHIFQGLCICVFLLAVNISFSFSEETDLLVPFASTAPTFPLGDRHPTAPQRLKTAGPVPTHTFGRNLILGDGSDPVFTQPYTIRAPTQRPFGIVASHTDCRVEGPSVANDKARARFYDVPFEGTLGMTAAEALNSTAAAGDRFEITYMDSFATHLRFSLNDSNVSPLGGSEMRVPLVRGMAYVTTEYTLSTPVLFSSTGLVDEKGDHIPDGAEFLLKWSPLAGGVKMAETLIRLDTGQTWVCYLFASAGSPAPSALRLMRAWGGAVSALSTQTRFSGVVRLAKLEEERGRETSSVVALRASLLRVHAPAVVQGAQIALRANASLATLTVSWSAYTMGGSTVQPLQFALPHHLQALGILTAHTSGTGEPISPMRQATTAERAAAAEVAVAKGMKSDTNLRPGRLGAERALEAVHREMQMAAADEPLFETRVETGFKSIRRQNLGDFDVTEEAEIYSVSESEKKVEATHLWLRSTTQGVMRAVVGSQWVMPETLPFARATGFLPEGRIRVETIPALLDALDLDLGATGAMQSKRIAWAVRTEGIYTSGRELWRHAQLCLLQRALLPLYPTNSSLSQALTVLANATHANTKPTIGGESVGTPLSRSDAEIRLRNSVGALAQALDTFPRGESGNPFVREQVWGGVVGSLGLGERSAPSLDFGSAWYHDHLAHFGYIIAAAAALESLSPGWAVGNRKWVDTLARDVASPVSDHFAPQLRHTDLFDGHAWSLGLFHSKQGRELESVSEEIHGYYALSLWGKVTGRVRLERLGRALLALATRAHRNSFFMTPPDDGTPVTVLAHPIRALRNYVPGMSSEGRIDYSTWTRAGPEYIHGIQMLPVSPALVSARTPEHAHAEWVSVLAPVAARAGSVWAAVLEQHRALVDPRAAFSRLSILARFGRSLDAGMSRSWALFWASVSPEPEMGPHDSHLQSPRGTPFPDALAGSCAQGWHGLAAEIGSDGDGGAPAGKPDEAGEHTVKVWAGVVNVDPAAAGLVVPIVNTWPAHPALRPGASTSPTLRALVWGLGALCVILLTIIVVLSLIAQRQYARAQAAEAHVEKMALAGLSAAQTAAIAGGDQRSRSNATTRPVSRSNEEAPTARSAENAWVEDADDILIAARAMQAQVRDMSPSPTPLSGEGRFLWPVQEGVTRREIP